ncbi:FtsX-like permease family protein [Gemelliphila palaticanis]|uniref:FtsX-like permease family protein n=1 Tax=Gemelliphila palaticanis TaxID=81950 RepID=A0ABX2T017_9BACL|nr:FtsX-like permease family protein [Gemella palaticanis]MBF0715965.1 FtsX-like permease family protein [Gemella palaticanis]NYS47895.1 FtsX-like permease family protein [Gemella palaticanis]
MSALNKDIFREIKKTKSKFLSIIIIIFLGVFVFTGLEETPPTMIRTVNDYFKKYNVYDLKITNRFGLTKEDLQVIDSFKGIEHSEKYYSYRAKDKTKNYDLILESTPEKINIPKIIKGRLPENNDEIVLTEALINEFNLGENIKLELKVSKDSTQTVNLKNNTFKIVGFIYGVDFPENSTNNVANTNYFAYINKDNFESEYVSGVNLILENSPRDDFSSENYYSFVNKKRDELVTILKNQQEVNNYKFKKDNEKTFLESKNTLEEYSKQIAKAEENLLAYKEFLPEAEYNKNISDLEKNKQELKEKEELLTLSKKRIDSINYPRFSIENIKGNAQYKQFIESSSGLKSIANIFSIFLFLVAILVSLATITRMIDENRTNIGTFKALGYSKVSISKKYYLYGLLSSVIGAILGVIGAYLVIVPIIYNSYARFLTLKTPVVKSTPFIVVLAFFISLICIFLAVKIPLSKILKERTAYLLRPKAPKSGSRILLEKIPFIWKRLSFLRKVTFRNIFRYKVRMLMTIFGILGCLSLMFIGFGIRYGVINISNEQFKNIHKYNVIATYNPYLTESDKNELDKMISNNSNIDDFAKINISRATIENNNEIVDGVTVAVFDENINVKDFFDIKNENGNIEIDSSGVVINEKLAYLHNLDVGSKFKIILNEKEYELTVSNINESYFGHLIYMTSDYYKKVIGENFDLNSYLIKAGFDENKVDNIMKELEVNTNILNLQNNLKFQISLDNFIEGIDIIVLVIVLCSVTLALVVLYNLININISERIRELSTIKVLGFYPKEVTTYVFREIFYLGLIGIIIGNYVGYLLYKKIILDLAAREMMFESLPSIYVYLLASGVTLLIILLVMIIMHVRLKKVNMVESLKGVE